MKTSKLFGCFAALAVAGFAWANEPVESATVETTESEVELTEETDNPLTIELSLDVMSHYVFRGIISNDRPVWQPSVTVGYETEELGGIYANVWSSFDLTRNHGTDAASRRACGLHEIDYSVGYTYNLFGFDLELAHIWYSYPNDSEYSSERDIYASISYENPFLTPTASVYWLYEGGVENHDKDSCLYYVLGVEHEFDLTEQWTLTPYATLGIGGNAWGQYVADSKDVHFHTEMIDQTIGVSTAFQISDNISIGGQINYTWLPSRTVRRAGYMDGGDKDHLVWGGVNVTLSF